MCLAVPWNTPVACNSAWRHFMIASAPMDEEYHRLLMEEIDT
jgi:hypothetical protein